MRGVETGKHKKGAVTRSKKNTMGAIYQVKCKTERKEFGRFLRRHYQKCNLFKVAKRMVKTNQGIIDEQCVKIMVYLQEVMKIRTQLERVITRSF